jgi:hypothetical protein
VSFVSFEKFDARHFGTFATISALTAIRCGAQNSVAIGGAADIMGLEPVGGSIENDPKQR